MSTPANTPMRMNFIDLKAQYVAYKEEINHRIQKVLDSAAFINGPEVKELETALEKYTGSRHAIACSNGTDALILALMAYDLKPGDEVITTPFTFFASAEVAAFLGFKPVFVDIEDQTYNIDPAKLEAKITKRTKAIIPVSIFGQTPNMDMINAIGEKHGIPVIEDAAQSFGATFNGRKSCNLSPIATTSFFPAKPLGAYGDAGAVFCQDAAMAEKIKMLREHGQVKRYTHKYIGINGRLDTIQAAILLVKLKYFDQENATRQKVADRYEKGLGSLKKIKIPKIMSDRTSAWAQYSICTPERDKLVDFLTARGIPTSIHYPTPVHTQECFKPFNYADDCPITNRVCKEIVALPMSPFLSEQDQALVIKSIQEYFA